MSELPELLTTEEAADYLRVGDTRTVLKLIKEGKIKAAKIGKGYKIRKDELLRFIKDEEKRKD